MEYERLAQRMQALFGSFNDDDNDNSDIEQFQRDYNKRFSHQMHQSEFCPDSHSTHEAQSWLPWRQHDLCRANSAMETDIWLNGDTLQENQLISNEGTEKTCVDMAGSQSPATDRKSSKFMSVLADSDYSMHHQEMYYAHHRHHGHHSHAGGPVSMHAAQTEPSRFETLLSLDDDTSHSSHCDAHHSFDYPHHHQHYRLHHHHHHHRHGHQFSDYPQVNNLIQNALMQDETVGCNAVRGNHLDVQQFGGNMNCIIDHDADYDKPLTLEDLKEYHRKKMVIENSLHNTCSLQVRVMQWLNDAQNDPTLLTAKDDSISAEHVL